MAGFDLSGRLPLKVCGLTRAEDVRLCLRLGAAMTGFVFAASSPRRLSPAAAARLPCGEAARVGVFAGHTVEDVLRIMEQARLDYAQLHGVEDESCCRAVGRERVIKVVWPHKPGSGPGENGLDVSLNEQCQRFAPVCAFFLLDAGIKGGGSGMTLPWTALRDFNPPRPWLLAGGLSPENLPSAAASCSPWAFDCNSGVEKSPGVKSAEKLTCIAREL
jgi:phosphoribosylanthranilate isomerase